MADYHSVDSGDQHIAAEGVADHSDLTTFYAEAKHEVLGPWMQEDERQKAMQIERDKIQTGLRKSVILIGLGISMPLVLGILLGQLFLAFATPSTVYTFIFIVIILSLALLITTVILLRWVAERFQKHSIRALPITLTTLLCLFLVVQRTFDLFDGLVGGIVGYAVALAALPVIGILIATITIFAWTSPKLSWVLKLLVIFVFLGVSTAIFYLA
jgi:hypothetical protein